MNVRLDGIKYSNSVGSIFNGSTFKLIDSDDIYIATSGKCPEDATKRLCVHLASGDIQYIKKDTSCIAVQEKVQVVFQVSSI